MDMKKLIALCGATGAVAIAPTVALATGGGKTTGTKGTNGPKVTVRIEGAKKELLAPTTVQTHRGWVTKDGTKKGACPDTDAAGALDVATHGKWGGTQDKSFGLELTTIFGEKHTFKSPMFWDLFINNKVAQAGICGLKLHNGDSLVFAATSIKKPGDLIQIKAPKSATVNKPFDVKVVLLNAKGKGTPLSGAKVSIGKQSVVTKTNGVVTVKSGNAGKVVLRATHKGEVRSAPVTVNVSS
jgi:hypothetical protein